MARVLVVTAALFATENPDDGGNQPSYSAEGEALLEAERIE